jgi:tetratricopeptide (TPR) repeat protein
MTNSRRLRQLLAAALMAIFLAGCSRDPNVIKQKYVQSGTRYFEKGKYREAAIQFQNAIKLDPRYAEAHYQLARCFLKMEIWNSAFTELSRTVDLNPQNSKARIDLGNLLAAAHEFKRAEEQARSVLSREPDNVDAHTLLGTVYAIQNDLPASLTEMKTALELAPGRSESYLRLASIQANAKQLAEAEENFKKAIQLDPKSVPVLLGLGDFYLRQQRWLDAEQQYRRAIELEPKSRAPRTALARLYFAQGQKAQAEQVLAEAKKALPSSSENYRILGDFYFETRQFDKALAEYASLSQEHPKDLVVKKNYIQLLLLGDRLDEAAKWNEQILKADAKDADALIYKGQILNRQQRANDAIPVLQAALKTAPDNAVGHYNLGIAFGQVGNMAQAESQWREAVRIRPNMVAAQQELAELALRKGDLETLDKSAEQLIAAEPSSPSGYIFRAVARIARKDLTGGEADLKKAVEVAPQSPKGYAALGKLRASQKRFSEAEKLYEQALDRDPNYFDAMQGLLSIYMQQKEPAKALARLNAQIAKTPSNSAYYLLQGRVLIDTNDLENAEAALQKAAELNKNDLNTLLLLAQVQTRRGSVEKAIASYEHSIQINPRDVRSYVLLGTLEESRGNWQKAQVLYQKALQAEPDYPVAANNLAYLLLEHGGNPDVALSYAQVARRGMPDSTDSADTMAWAYYQKGAFELAIDLLEDAVKKAPQNPTYQYHLGLACLKTNKRVQAKEHLERALQINPKYPHADEIRKTLSELAGG